MQCKCGHYEREHDEGVCLAQVRSTDGRVGVCPCIEFVPRKETADDTPVPQSGTSTQGG